MTPPTINPPEAAAAKIKGIPTPPKIIPPAKAPQPVGHVYLPGAPEPVRGNKKDWT